MKTQVCSNLNSSEFINEEGMMEIKGGYYGPPSGMLNLLIRQMLGKTTDYLLEVIGI